MILSECICITYDNQSELTDIERVLGITKSVLAVTAPMPTISWTTNDNHVFIFADSNELSIIRIVLQNNLGLFNEAPNFNSPQHRYAVPRLNTDENCIGLRETADVGVSTTFVRAESGAVSNTDFVLDNEGDDFSPMSLSQSDLVRLSAPTNLDEGDEPSCENRRTIANTERSFATIWEGESVLDDSSRSEWQLVLDRFDNEPNPTDSASGTIGREEQIAYSELHNPRHWNIVKCSYNGSRYYLSYICPPSVNIFDTLRIIGGIHANDTPDIREICVYNTEPYWRELRHMMHQGVTSLREAVAA